MSSTPAKYGKTVDPAGLQEDSSNDSGTVVSLPLVAEKDGTATNGCKVGECSRGMGTLVLSHNYIVVKQRKQVAVSVTPRIVFTTKRRSRCATQFT